ncbi:MAG: hypothetical protein P1U69_04915 [Parvibaculaceae bacterium]|nr:hypothetical protein [Parvibaculaceae bacterium]HBM88153.1 hypothetical protein [Rhodobiaceae bacterium]
MLARILAALPGLAMGINAFMWITNPAAAAESLGMPLLDGIGRSTQAGDFAAFFFACSVMAFLAAWKQNATWAYGAALILGGAAVFRTLAWAIHGAEFATVFIVVEAVLTLMLVASAQMMKSNA